MEEKPPTLFARWMSFMGFPASQPHKAAASIGIARHTATQIHEGNREPNRTELLAMSAARAGLPEWSPEVDGDLLGLLSVIELDGRSIIDQYVLRRMGGETHHQVMEHLKQALQDEKEKPA